MSLSVGMCLSVYEHIFGTAGPIFTKFLRRSPVAVARSSSGGVAILCTSGFIDDVTFGRNGPYGNSGGEIPGRCLMSMNAF